MLLNDITEELVKNAMRGDNDATAMLMELVLKKVLYYTMHMLRTRMDAEDAAQNVMIRVCTKIGTLKNSQKFDKWVKTIVINETRRYMEKNYKHAALHDVNMMETLENIEETDEDLLPNMYAEKNERSKIILDGVNKLTTRQKEAVYNVHYLELSLKETAKVMGITPTSVSDNLTLAYKKIKTELEENYTDGTAVAQGLIAIPIAAEIHTAFLMDVETLAVKAFAWLRQTAEGCEILIKSATAAKTAGGISSVFTPAVSVATAAVTVVAVSTGAYLISNNKAPQIEPPAIVMAGPVATDGGIIFTGGIEGGHVNPLEAEVWVDNELTAPIWRIEEVGGEDVIFDGGGNSVDGVFAQMRESGMDGRYILVFSMEDNVGGAYTVEREFTIRG